MKTVLAERLLHAYLPRLERETHNAHDWQLVDGVDADVLSGAEVLVGGHLPAGLAAAAPRLRLVQTPGAGYEGIDLDGLGPEVVIANTFHHGRSIAEYVVLVTLALHRQLCTLDRELRAGRWLSPRYVPDHPAPQTLRGKVAGVIGLGEIGSEVVRLLTAFDMHCVAIRSNPSRPAPPGVDLDWLGSVDDLPHLCAEADVVVVTVPHSEQFGVMKPDALLVNVARGPVVDEDALYTALAKRRIGGAALDVWWRYPDTTGQGKPSTAPFADLPNLLMTPHISGVTEETFRRRAADIAGNINHLTDGHPLHNTVHAP